MQVRRATAPLKPRAPDASLPRSETPEADALRLVETFRLRAYSEARRRQRLAQREEAALHWTLVANLIARRSDGLPGAAATNRVEPGANPTHDDKRAPIREMARFFEADPLAELERVLAAKPQQFRLQFFGVDASLGPAVLKESEIQAFDASGAIREAVEVNWPPKAVGLRVLDCEGREIFERLKADLH
jgi:hypothetical protein